MLSDTAIKNAKPRAVPFKLVAGKGLYLEIRPSGSKLWRYRYRIAGKENVFALGEYVAAPRGETEAEAGLEDRETARVSPARGQPVAAEKHVARLRRAALGAVVDVAVGLRIRRAVGGEGKAGRDERGAHPAIVRR